MLKKDIQNIVKDSLSPIDVARLYLGPEYKMSGNSLVYYSPLRDLERTPSMFFDNTKGIRDFRNWNKL